MFVFNKERGSMVYKLRLSRLNGLLEHPAFRYDFDIEGYSNYTFGCRAGPSINLSNLFHELAHAVEFGADNFRYRAYEYGFRFSQKSHVTFGGIRYIEPKSWVATEREIRTIAIQTKLLKMVGVKTAPEKIIQNTVDALDFMPDWYNIPIDEKLEDAKLYREFLCLMYYHACDEDDIMVELLSWLDKTGKRIKV